MFSGMNKLFYPMSADIYYATKQQNDFGEITRSWTKNRSIMCSAIKQNPNSRTSNFIDVKMNIQYDIVINIRTYEDVQKSLDNSIYKITDILITNIKDASGNVVWKEDLTTATVFEISAIEPMLNTSNNVMGYRILCTRSDSQEL